MDAFYVSRCCKFTWQRYAIELKNKNTLVRAILSLSKASKISKWQPEAIRNSLQHCTALLNSATTRTNIPLHVCFFVEGADEPREDHGSIHGSYRVKEVSRENRFDFFLAMAICRGFLLKKQTVS